MFDTEKRPFSLEDKRVLVTGYTGMAGGAIYRRLQKEPCGELIGVGHTNINMLRQKETEDYLASVRPDVLFIAAAKVGGILANFERPATFLYENLVIQTNLIGAAHAVGVKKLIFLGSSCIYPRLSPQPMTEEALLTGPLEPTNEGYAIAKIAGIKLCDYYRKQYGCDYISAMPTNLYGPGDRYDPVNGHVVAALIMKVHEAKTKGKEYITLWGTGTPRREFLYTEDLADAVVYMAKNYSDYGHLNIGTGIDISIRELAETIAKAAGWEGKIVCDATKPDGMPRKVMDVSRLMSLGWSAGTNLDDGIKIAYKWYVARVKKVETQ